VTTRDDARRSRGGARDDARGDARGADRPRPPAEPAGPSLPARLLAARERKGVDLFRAERDTKIRARYLAALERGEYRELPGAVYTKGFLRNYALYLGLDPEDVIRQWKRERGDAAVPAEPVLTVPRPLAAPRGGFTFSPVVIVAALLTVLVLVFAGYVVLQLVRFAKPPTLAVTSPSTLVLDVAQDTASYTLRGTSIAGATITVTSPGLDQPYRVSADADGHWTLDVALRRGPNQFDVTAVDPDTGKQAETPIRLRITVPFLVVESPTLTLDSPSDSAQYQNGAVPIKGSTTGKTVSVSAYLVGGSAAPSAAPTPTPKPGASVSPAPTKDPNAPTVGPVSADVAADGTFDSPLSLSTGQWRIVVTATSAEGKATSITRNVTIAYQGVNMTVTVKGGRAWMKVWVDGVLDPGLGQSGKIVGPATVLTFTAKQSVEVRTGNAGVTYFTLNGTDLGLLSTSFNPGTWLFAPPDPPVQTNRS
jgi:cytoskeletal protein RodZ